MSQQTETVQPESQASPLAGDVLNLLRTHLRGGQAPPTGQEKADRAAKNMARKMQGLDPLPPLDPGLNMNALGTGISSLQREAGTAIRQFVNSGGQPFDVSGLVGDIRDIQTQNRERGLADIGEQFGAAGSTMGTPLAVGSARFLSDVLPRQEREIGELMFGAHESAADRLMQGINLMQTFGLQNIAPFLEMAGLGIHPEETIVKENPWVTAAKLGIGGAKAASGFQGLGAGSTA